MPLQETSGAASYDAFGGGAAAIPNYIEDVFSTYLYTGTGSTQTITNGIDLAGEGGMVWARSRGASNHFLGDTARGVNKRLIINSDAASTGDSSRFNAFNSNGFETGLNLSAASVDYVSWTFRKQPKFFDVVTYTGDGTSNRNISHAIGGTVGCVIVKRTDSTGEWMVYHQGSTDGNHFLNQAVGGLGSNAYVNGVSSTTFTVSSVANTNAATYVAYIFAHNAGGFGLTGTENVITCGSYTGDGTATGSKEINLGFEPQFLIVHGAGDWVMADNMRCMNYGGANTWQLKANDATAEGGYGDFFRPTATGFKIFSSNANANASGTNYIYIAIRRGPMKVPTIGTQVFSPVVRTGTDAPTAVTVGFAPDLVVTKRRFEGNDYYWIDKLRGALRSLNSASTAAEISAAGSVTAFNNTGFVLGNNSDLNGSGAGTNGIIHWSFARAPGFFDVVCYTGTGGVATLAHNLGAVPQMMIVKSRTQANAWWTYLESLGNTKAVGLQTTNTPSTSTNLWNNTSPTATQFTVGLSNSNSSSDTYVAYLFATCPGVSKVGSYTGTGTTNQINCGFTAGARFILIRRTDSTGDWYVWDSARGVVAGNDPYLFLNSTAAEVTSTDYIDTAATGFELSSTAPAAINANGGTFIFLAIA
jgi:hypothetical protein